MKKNLFIFFLLLFFIEVLNAQTSGVVLATYRDSVYMRSLKNAEIQLPESFLQEIRSFNITSIEQAFPYSKNGFLLDVVAFNCEDNTVLFADYLSRNATHLFSKVEYELDQESKPDYDPSDTL